MVVIVNPQSSWMPIFVLFSALMLLSRNVLPTGPPHHHSRRRAARPSVSLVMSWGRMGSLTPHPPTDTGAGAMSHSPSRRSALRWEIFALSSSPMGSESRKARPWAFVLNG
jgi:hypothetical protein